MTSGNKVSVFDGHNDLAYQLWRRGDTGASAFLNTDEDRLHITYKQAKTGGLAAGLFALFVPQQGESLEATAVIDEQDCMPLNQRHPDSGKGLSPAFEKADAPGI